MINAEKNIFLLETEIKPNKYVSIVMAFLAGSVGLCWLLNEFGIFHVGLNEMRIGALIPIGIIVVTLVTILLNKDLLEKPIIKWVMLVLCDVFTLSMTTLLTFHTTLMLLIPIFLAMLYRSVKLGVAACISSVFCTVATPILGYLLHAWDIPLFQELILIGTNVQVDIVGATNDITLVSLLKIVLYLVFPRLILVVACSLLMFYVIRLGVTNVENQIMLDRISHRDELTGLYNQNYYKTILESEARNGTVGVLFFDVNGLKTANDTKGHEYGDLLIKRNAKSIADICDGIHTFGFRIGGDEFLVLIENADKEAVKEKLNEWQYSLQKVNSENKESFDNLVCSMAVGASCGEYREIERIVHEADVLMYQNKAAMKGER